MFFGEFFFIKRLCFWIRKNNHFPKSWSLTEPISRCSLLLTLNSVVTSFWIKYAYTTYRFWDQNKVDKSFLNPFLWTEPPVNPHNGIVEQVGLTSQEKYERYATDKIETFAIFRSKGIHLLQSGEKYVKSKLNQLFLQNLNGFYTMIIW